MDECAIYQYYVYIFSHTYRTLGKFPHTRLDFLVASSVRATADTVPLAMVVVSRLLASGPTNPPRAPSPLPRPLDDVHEAIHAPSLPRLVVHDQVELRLSLRRRRAQQRLGLLVALDAHVLRHVCRRVGGEANVESGWDGVRVG